MLLRHPFQWIAPSAQKKAFIALLILALVLMLSLQVLGEPLQTSDAPLGIVSFELAGSLSAARSVLESWGPRGRIDAGLNLGLDYLFLFAYTGAIGLGCVLLAQDLSRRIRSLALAGVVLAWGLILAGLLDAVENYALIHVLLGSQREFWPVFAQWCAVAKFLIVAAALLFLCLGLMAALVLRFGNRKRRG